MGMNTYPMVEKAAFFVGDQAAKLIWAAVFGEDEPYEQEDLCDLAQKLDFVHADEFDGEVSTLFPELAKDPLCLNFDDEPLVFIPCQAEPDLFKAPYSDKEALLDEFKKTLEIKGISLPEDFDWWRYVVTVSGTYFC